MAGAPVQDPTPKTKTPRVDALYKAFEKEYDLGTIDQFRETLKDQKKRKAFYDAVTADEWDLGTPEEYEKKVSSDFAPPRGFWGNVKDVAVFTGKGLWSTLTKQVPSEFRTEDLRLSKGAMADMFDSRSNIRATKFKSNVITPEVMEEYRKYNNSAEVRALGLSKNARVDSFLKKKFGSKYESKKKEFEKEVVDYRINIEKDIKEYNDAYNESMEGTPGDISDVTTDNVGKFIGNFIGQGLGRIPTSILSGGTTSFISERAAVFNSQLDKLSQKTGLTREEIIKKGLDEPETGRILADFLGATDVVSAGSVVSAPGKKVLRKTLSIGGEMLQETIQGEGEEIGGAMGSGTGYTPKASRMLTSAVGGALGAGPIAAVGMAKSEEKPVVPSDALVPAEKQEDPPKSKAVIVNDDVAEIRQTNFVAREDGTEVATYDTGLTVKGTNKPVSLRSEKAPDGTITFSGEGIAPFQAESVEKAVAVIKEESEVEWKKIPVVTGKIDIQPLTQDDNGAVYNSGLVNKETGEPIRIVKKNATPLTDVSFETENGTIKGATAEEVAEKVQAVGIPHVPVGGDIKANAIIASEGVTEQSIQRIYEEAYGYTPEQAKKAAPAMDVVNVRAKEKNITPEQAFFEIAKMRAVEKEGGTAAEVKAAGDNTVVAPLLKQPEAEQKLKEKKAEKGGKVVKKPKAKTDAVQKQETKRVPVQSAPRDSKAVGEKVRSAEKPADKSSQKTKQVVAEKPVAVEEKKTKAKAIDYSNVPKVQQRVVKNNEVGGWTVVSKKNLASKDKTKIFPIVEMKKGDKTVFINTKGDTFNNVGDALAKSEGREEIKGKKKPAKKPEAVKPPAKKVEAAPVVEKPAPAPVVEKVEKTEPTPVAETKPVAEKTKAAPSQESVEIFEILSGDIFPTTVKDLTEAIQELSGYEGKLGEAKAVARVKQMQDEGVIKVEGKKVTPTYEVGDSALPVSEETIVAANAKQENPVGIIYQKGFMFDTDLAGLWKKTKHAFTEYLTTKGFLPQDVFDKWNKTKAEIKKYEAQVAFTVKDLKSAVAEEYGKVLPHQVRDMNLYLQGQSTIDPVKPKTKQILDTMRAQVDNLSTRMVNEGVVAGDLAAKITANQGVYLNRSYRKYDDPKWNAPEQVKNKAMGFIRAQYPGYTDAEVQGLLDYLMTNPESPMNIIVGGGLDRIDLTALRKRGDIAPEIRALMGEYEDPILNYARSIGKMAQMVAKNHFQQDVKRDGVGVYMFDKPTGEHNVKIDAGKVSAFRAADGSPLYATKEVAAVLAEYDKQQVNPPWLKMLLKANAHINFGLTVLSPTTHSRNFLSNAWFALSNGHLNPVHVPKAIAAWQGVNPTKDQANRAKWLEYVELGIVGEGVTIGVLHDYIKDINDGVSTFEPDPLVGKSIKKTAKKYAVKAPEKMYHFGDNVWKIFAYESEVDRYRKAFPNWSEEQVKAAAAENVKNTYPTYSRVPKAIRTLKNIPVVGGFVSFPSEVVRTTFNTAELAVKEMRSGNEELFKVGVKRMAGLIAAISVPTLMSYATRAMLSMDGEDEDDLRKYLAPWQENNELFYINREGSKYTYADIGPFDPHSMLKKPVYAFLRGGDLKQSSIDALQEMFTPFISEQVGSAALIDIKRNQTSLGRPIYDENAPLGVQQDQIISYLLQKAAPGLIKSGSKLYDAANGEVNQYGEEYKISNEVVAVWPGIRVKTLDIELATSFKASEHARALATAKSFRDKKTKYDKSANKADVERANEIYRQTVTNIAIKSLRDYDAAVRLGASGRAFNKLKLPSEYIDWDRVNASRQQ